MMHDFTTALCSKVRNGRIPEEYDFFAILPLLKSGLWICPQLRSLFILLLSGKWFRSVRSHNRRADFLESEVSPIFVSLGLSNSLR